VCSGGALMPDGLDVQITGLAEVCKQLEELPRVVVKRCYKEALDAALVPVLEALDPLIPVHTSNLRAHAMFVINIDADGRSATASIGFGDAGRIALWLEMGHREVGHRPDLKLLGEYAPHPFMRIAFEESNEQAIEAFTARLTELVSMNVIVIDNRTV
jgi:HK97 gp10 family phage protein